MTWARLDDGFWRNPKIQALTPGEFKLYVNAITYAADQLTDGLITPAALRTIAASSRLRYPLKAASVLATSGLWDRESTPDGHIYRIHDYLVYNPSKAHVQKERARNAERVRRHRNAVSNAVTPTVSNAISNAAPTRTPKTLEPPQGQEQAPSPVQSVARTLGDQPRPDDDTNIDLTHYWQQREQEQANPANHDLERIAEQLAHQLREANQ